MKNLLARCAVAAALIGGATAASATVNFLFNPTGGGVGAGVVTGDLLDQAPGNAYAIGGSTAVINCFAAGGLGCANPFTLLYQANLTSVSLGGINQWSQGAAAPQFHFTAGFGELVTSATGVGVGAGATFAFDAANPVNFFNMRLGSGNNLTGAGFGTGAVILSGTVTAGAGTTLNQPQLATALDNAGGNNWSGTGSVQATGATQLTLNINFADTNYFPDLMQLGSITISFVNTSQVAPFNQADPSCAMIGTNGATQGYAVGAFNAGTQQCATVAGVTIGTINGDGNAPDFIFQADANQSFDRVVPEPGSLALLASGLIAAGLIRRRRA